MLCFGVMLWLTKNQSDNLLSRSTLCNKIWVIFGLIEKACFFGFLGFQVVEIGHWELSENWRKLRKIWKPQFLSFCQNLHNILAVSKKFRCVYQCGVLEWSGDLKEANSWFWFCYLTHNLLKLDQFKPIFTHQAWRKWLMCLSKILKNYFKFS